MSKNFEDLTIADDFMFCKVMQDETFCKPLIEMILSDTIGKIATVSTQHNITTYEQAKSVRFDILVQTEAGNLYDVEMQVSNQRNISKRMRFYQAAIDISCLDKGVNYNNLNDSFIIFICLFDVMGKDKPVYTFENICLEDKAIVLQDGTKKIILNAEAFEKTENKNLQEFLRYLKTGKTTGDFTRRIEDMIREVKTNEQARQEYRLLSTFEMDARRAGREEGRIEGFSDGVRQKALETAKLLKQFGDSVQKIMQATGLSEEEIEKL